jgi:GNAT superfamily N-acetyltransferase
MAGFLDFGPRSATRVLNQTLSAEFGSVRQDMQSKRLGTALVIDAMKRCLGITEQMGAAAIVLDVLDGDHSDRKWRFYSDLGFRPLGDLDNPRRVYIPMADVRATLR